MSRTNSTEEKVHIGTAEKGQWVDRDWWESLSSKSKEQELRHLERTTIVEEDRDDGP